MTWVILTAYMLGAAIGSGYLRGLRAVRQRWIDDRSDQRYCTCGATRRCWRHIAWGGSGGFWITVASAAWPLIPLWLVSQRVERWSYDYTTARLKAEVKRKQERAELERELARIAETL